MKRNDLTIIIALILFSIGGIAGIVFAAGNGFNFKVEPLISESEIVAFDIDDANYINENFDSLVLLLKIQNIQPPKECFSIDKCIDEKKEVETWCAQIVYGIPDTSFTQTQGFCTEVIKASKQTDIEQSLQDEAQKTFDSIKFVSPPIYIVDQSDPLVDDEYNYLTQTWERK